ncbi:MAG TPA: hypothetical protein VFW07_13630 [Parafilimonas sp.]|nr:hypothetical protein [Parafilimonas sp.]
MKEEQKITGKAESEKSGTGNVPAHFPEDSHAPEPETSNQQPVTSNQQTETGNQQPASTNPRLTDTVGQEPSTNQTSEIKDMEVHKHPHHITHKKKLGEYLLEFLMLFLAVFLGFIAENIREHYVEHERMKQYAGLLLADLERDTAWFNAEKKHWEDRQPDFDTLISLLVQPVPSPDERILKKLLYINYVSDAKLNVATYNQMKTSGSLRYVNDRQLIEALEDYYEIQLPHAVESSQSTMAFFNTYIRTFFIDHLRNQDINSDTSANRKPLIIGRTASTDQRLSNIIEMDRTLLYIANDFYDSAGKKAVDLIELLKKEYHID